MRGAGAAWVVLLLVLLAASGQAAPVRGTLFIGPDVDAPAGAVTEMDVLAALLTMDETGAAALHAPAARVIVTEARIVDVGFDAPRFVVSVDERSYPVTDANLTTTPDKEGWVGLYPTSTATARLVGDFDPSIRNSTRLSSAIASSTDPRTGGQYDASVAEPHLLVDGTGVATFTGGGELKILGPRVEIVARENTTRYETGTMRVSSTESIERHVRVQYDAATLQIETQGATLSLAGRQVAGRWDGRTLVAPVGGIISTPESDYRPAGATAYLDGNLQVSLVPDAEGDGGTIQLTGELERTSMRPSDARAPAPAPATGPGWLPPLLLVLGAVVAAGATGYVVRARLRAREPPLAPEEYAALADEAAEAEDWDEAVRWIELARKSAPHSQRLAEDEAFFLQQAGRTKEALRALEAALAMQPTAWGIFQAALLRAKLGRPDEDVLPLLERAARMMPELAIEIETASELEDIIRRHPSLVDRLYRGDE